jgi:hypothetical protein
MVNGGADTLAVFATPPTESQPAEDPRPSVPSSLAMAYQPQNLQQLQTTSLLNLLNLNSLTLAASTDKSALPFASQMALFVDISILHIASPNGTTGPAVWKVLILDNRSKDVLATVMRVQDLRDVGVTLHVYVPFSELKRLSLTRLASAFQR